MFSALQALRPLSQLPSSAAVAGKLPWMPCKRECGSGSDFTKPARACDLWLVVGGAVGPSPAAWNNCSHLPVLPFQPGLPDACLWPRGQPALQTYASLSLTSRAAFSPSWSIMSWGFGGLEAVVHLQSVWLFVTPWTAACQAPLSSTISWSLLKFMSIQLVILSNHVILCSPLLILSSHLSQHQDLFQ